MTTRIVLDTNVLVALIDTNDKFHLMAQSLLLVIQAAQLEEVYFDCVMVETIGVLCRRAEEQRRSHQIPMLLQTISQKVPSEIIVWLANELQIHFDDVIDLVGQTKGMLNFNDALIAIICREWKIDKIASFDQDFDQIVWLKRLSNPTDIQSN